MDRVEVQPAGKSLSMHQIEVSRRSITVDLWRDVTGSAPPSSQCDESCFVTGVNYYEATHFLNLLSERTGRSACYELKACTKNLGDGLTCARADRIEDCSGFQLPSARYVQQALIQELASSDPDESRYHRRLWEWTETDPSRFDPPPGDQPRARRKLITRWSLIFCSNPRDCDLPLGAYHPRASLPDLTFRAIRPVNPDR